MADAPTKARRRLICEKCPLMLKGKVPQANTCSKCGCNIVGKTMLRGASCPLGKW